LIKKCLDYMIPLACAILMLLYRWHKGRPIQIQTQYPAE